MRGEQENIKVLSVIHYPVFGGPHNRNLRLAEPLAASGFETVVYLPDQPGNAALRLREAGVRVIENQLGRLRNVRDPRVHLRFMREFLGDIGRLRATIRAEESDIVQVNGFANPHAAVAARLEGVPVVWQVLDTYTPGALRWVEGPLVARLATVTMCTGRKVAKDHPGIERARNGMVLFYPPVDTTEFTPASKMAMTARLELGLVPGELVVGTVGNLNYQKGHDSFILAAASLRQHCPNAKFVIFGSAHRTQRSYVQTLRELAESLGLVIDRDLLILNPGDRIAELAQVLDVFWMTSRPNSEGIPTAMEEAMALEIPVVSFPAGSIAELVEQGVSGFVTREHNVGELVRLTRDYLLDESRRKSMGGHGRDFVQRHASLAACAERHVAAYRLAMD